MIRTMLSSVALLLLGGVARLEAASMYDYDMASLWHMSGVVVEGEELGYTLDNYWLRGKVRVTRVHKGKDKIDEGDEIPVAIMMFSRRSTLQDSEIETNQVLLFLKWNEQGDSYRPAKHYLVVASGIKLILDEQDIVYRFEQEDNPGSYVPVRQGPELIDRGKLARRKVSKQDEETKESFPGYWESRAYVYGREALRQDLQLARQRAERFNRAVDDGDVDALASFLPSTLPMAIWTYENRPFVRGNYGDALALAAAMEFVKHADADRIAAALEKQKGKLTYSVYQTLKRAVEGRGAGSK